jgi:hypothetical protein
MTAQDDVEQDPTSVIPSMKKSGRVLKQNAGEVKAESDMELVNRTARRIRIERDEGNGLVLGPFCALRAPRALLCALRLEVWLERGYVMLRAPHKPDEQPVEPTTIAGALSIAGAAALCQFLIGVSTSWIPSIAGLILVSLILAPEVTRWVAWRERADAPLVRDQIWRALGILVVCVTGFGLPVVAVFLQSGLALAELRSQSARALGFFGLFSLFVGSSATLPAMLFFLFAEQRRDVMKAQFHRDILRLDPALRTEDETEQVYAPLLGEALCARRGPLFFGPIILSTFLLSLGWVISVLPPRAAVLSAFSSAPAPSGAPLVPIELWGLFVPNRTAFTFAFLGTYFFALNMVFRRYVRADLGPKAYSHISVRIIIASVLAWVASQTWEGFQGPISRASEAISNVSSTVANNTSSSVASSVASDVSPWNLLLIAFFIGLVPETGLIVLYGLLKTRFVSFFVPALRDRDPLTELEGITLYDQARLLEEGIENIENLCHHNLIELLLRTRIPAPRLVDLVDQAILYLHARDEARESESRGAQTLRKLNALGIRTATDFEQVIRHAHARVALEKAFGDDALRLELIGFALEDDEWMPQLRSWREFRRTYDTVYSADQLEETGAPRRDPPKRAAA